MACFQHGKVLLDKQNLKLIQQMKVWKVPYLLCYIGQWGRHTHVFQYLFNDKDDESMRKWKRSKYYLTFRVVLKDLRPYFQEVFNDVIEALRVSYRKMNPLCVHFAF